MEDDLKDETAEDFDEDSTVYTHLLKYKGALYACEKVEITKDTIYFQVDAQYVRKGLFPKNRLDMRWFSEMGIVYVPVHHPPLLEQ